LHRWSGRLLRRTPLLVGPGGGPERKRAGDEQDNQPERAWTSGHDSTP
jgi:hypothetical protein